MKSDVLSCAKPFIDWVINNVQINFQRNVVLKTEGVGKILKNGRLYNTIMMIYICKIWAFIWKHGIVKYEV